VVLNKAAACISVSSAGVRGRPAYPSVLRGNGNCSSSSKRRNAIPQSSQKYQCDHAARGGGSWCYPRARQEQGDNNTVECGWGSGTTMTTITTSTTTSFHCIIIRRHCVVVALSFRCYKVAVTTGSIVAVSYDNHVSSLAPVRSQR
jgi:hypothetical protein